MLDILSEAQRTFSESHIRGTANERAQEKHCGIARFLRPPKWFVSLDSGFQLPPPALTKLSTGPTTGRKVLGVIISAQQVRV